MAKLINAKKENAMACKAAIWYVSEYCPSEMEKVFPGLQPFPVSGQAACKKAVKHDV